MRPLALLLLLAAATVSVPVVAEAFQGVRYLVVSGTLLIDEGVMDPDLLPGRPVRREM